jgi:hypothetical protein
MKPRRRLTVVRLFSRHYDKLKFVGHNACGLTARLPALHGASLDSARLADDATEEFHDCLFIKRTLILLTTVPREATRHYTQRCKKLSRFFEKGTGSVSFARLCEFLASFAFDWSIQTAKSAKVRQGVDIKGRNLWE